MVDHTGPEWTVTDGIKVALLSGTEFGKLQVNFDAAVDYVAQHPSDHVPAWGLVTHITEYTKQGNGSTGPDKSALDALDAFLTHVDTKRADGRVVYSSPAAIARQAYP